MAGFINENCVYSAVRTKCLNEIRVNLRLQNRAKVHVVQPLIMEARVRSRSVCVGIFGQQLGSGAGKGKGKALPLQAMQAQRGLGELRLLEFLTTAL